MEVYLFLFWNFFFPKPRIDWIRASMELLLTVCNIPCNFASNTVRFHLYLGASQVAQL